MIGVTHLHHYIYLEAVGAYFDGSDIRGPEGPGYHGCVVPVAVEIVAGDRERVDVLLGVSEADGVLVGVEDAVHP